MVSILKVGTSLGRLLLLKSMAAAVLCHPLMGRMIGWAWRNKIPHRGCRIETPIDGDPRVNALLFWGMYESAEIRFVRRYLGDDLDVVELGSSLGGVACEIAKKLAGRRTLVCVEANGQIFPMLQGNVASNAPHQKVRFVQGAIDYSGNDWVEFSLGDSTLSSKLDGGGTGAPEKLTVPAMGLSRVVAENEIGDYALVADIEGAEAGLFARDTQALSRCRKMIIELHETSYDGKKYLVEDLIGLIENNTGMVMRDRYGPVCLFDK